MPRNPKRPPIRPLKKRRQVIDDDSDDDSNNEPILDPKIAEEIRSLARRYCVKRRYIEIDSDNEDYPSTPNFAPESMLVFSPLAATPSVTTPSETTPSETTPSPRESSGDSSDFIVPDDPKPDREELKRILCATIGTSVDPELRKKLVNKLEDALRLEWVAAMLPGLPNDDAWKREVTPEEAEQLEPILKQYRMDIKKSKPTVSRILRANLKDREKCLILQLYDAWHVMDPTDVNSIELGETMAAKIRQANKAAPISRKAEYREKKKDLMALAPTPSGMLERILDASTSTKNRRAMLERFRHWKNSSDEERSKEQEWLLWALTVKDAYIVPTTLVTRDHGSLQINEYLTQVRQKLDRELYGLSRAKDQIILALNDRIANPQANIKFLSFVGSPGTGKTKLARSLAEILQTPFTQISLGGTKDSGTLEGFSYTYVGARPGKIIGALKQLQCGNGIIYLDEVDKIGGDDMQAESQATSVLLHILDPVQNMEFRDLYLDELAIDLSKIWFILSMNDLNKIDPILRDRLFVIKIDRYKTHEKTAIFRDYLLPEKMAEKKIDPSSLIFPEDTIRYFVTRFDEEDGVRQLAQNLDDVLSKINLFVTAALSDGTLGTLPCNFDIPHFRLPFTVTPDVINKLLEQEKELAAWRTCYL